jgi:outer membrane protein W
MARSIVIAAMGVAVFGVSATAFAQEEESAGAAAAVSTDSAQQGNVHLGLRLGYGIPLGNSTGGGTETVGGITVQTEDQKLSDDISGMIPIWLDLGYFVTPNIMIGLYGHYGIALIADGDPARGTGCPEGADCSGSVIRFGLQGQYHLSRGQSLDPWFGLGVGYEILSAKQSAQGQEQSFSLKGFEFVNLQAGADFKVANNVAVGPFVSFSLGQYSSFSVDPEVPGLTDDIPNKSMHEWLTLGVKGSFGF